MMTQAYFDIPVTTPKWPPHISFFIGDSHLILGLPYPNSFASQCEQSDLIQADSFLMQDSSSKERYDESVAAITLVCVKLSGAQVNLKKEK